jgi:DNA ligase 1
MNLIKPNLAESADNAVLLFPKIASYKLDGVRCLTQDGKALSRSLKPIPNKHIQAMLKDYQGLDGELICGDPNAWDALSKTVSVVMSKDKPVDDVKFYVFDMLGSNQSYIDKYKNLVYLFNSEYGGDKVKLLPQHEIYNQDGLEVFYANALMQGYEGVILRNPSATYKQGRSTVKSGDMLKLKPFKDSEAVVLNTYEATENLNEAYTNELGRTARSSHQANKQGNGMIGGFIVKDVDAHGNVCSDVEYRVAAGRLTHEERKHIFANWELYYGRILKYRHMPTGAKDAPRFGRFIAWRDLIDMSK